MAKTPGSGNGYSESFVVRERPEKVSAIRKLSELRGQNFSDEVREALDKHLDDFAHLVSVEVNE